MRLFDSVTMVRIRLISGIIGYCVLGQVIVSPALALPTYSVTDLTELGGGFSGSAFSLNDNGMVVGKMFFLPSGINSAFTFNARNPSAGLNILGSLGGFTSTANGVSNSGLVSGILVNSKIQIRGFYFDTNNPTAGLQEIGTFGGEVSRGRDVNSSGLLVGQSTNEINRVSRAFYFDTNSPGNGLQAIGSLGGGQSVALAVNDNGLIAGFSNNQLGQNRAFTFDVKNPGAGLRDLGTIGGKSSSATSVNNNGLVVGFSRTLEGPGTFSRGHAMAIDTNNPNAVMLDLGTLPGGTSSSANAVNDNGLVVGTSLDQRNFSFRAVIFDTEVPDEVMHDLNDLIDTNDPLFGRIELERAFDINKFGDIAARGTINGRTHAFLLTAQRNVSVPEPSSIGAFFIGLICLAGMKRRRKRV